jgi:hypothetical protein
MSKAKKEYWNKTAAELAEATREFDRENVVDSFREMTPAEHKAWRAALGKRRRDRSVAEKGVKTVSVDIEARLLKRVDALAKKRGVTRARLVAEGLEAVLAK